MCHTLSKSMTLCILGGQIVALTLVSYMALFDLGACIPFKWCRCDSIGGGYVFTGAEGCSFGSSGRNRQGKKVKHIMALSVREGGGGITSPTTTAYHNENGS